MQTVEQLKQGWDAAPASPQGKGVVKAIGVRKGNGEHESAEHAELTVEGGLLGDRWAAGEDPKRFGQLTMMNVTVANLIAHVGRAGYQSGDNFYVDLDLSEDALTVGARMRIGTALIEVTPEPHNGCAKFMARYGKDALRWISEKENRPLRLRGIHCEVIEPGRVEVGDTVEVV